MHFCFSDNRIGRTVYIQINRTVYLHPDLMSGRTAVTIDEHRCLVRLDNMIAVEKLMEIVIHDSGIFFFKLYHPIRHVLSGNRQSIPLKLLFQEIKRHGIDMLPFMMAAPSDADIGLP